ncbi:MAG TPA: hypothetical protein VML55_07210 [Planctomycetaceae bacterium]|nr:hypothetical protein [Planctomycetaceae bacterium]
MAVFLLVASFAGAFGLARLVDHLILRFGGNANDATAFAVLILFLATLTIIAYASLLCPMTRGRMARSDRPPTEAQVIKWGCRIRAGTVGIILAATFLFGAGPMKLVARVAGVILVLAWVGLIGCDYCRRYSQLEWMPWDERDPSTSERSEDE